MKRFWMRALLCFALSAALLTGCALSPSSQPAESPTDPLTGQELVWPGQRPVAITIDNAAASTTQWGLSTASLVLEALTAQQQATRLCLVYPAVGAVPQVGPVSAGQDLYWRLLVGQQVLPVQRGGGQFDQNYLDYYSLRAVDALEVGTNAFSCETNWQNVPLWHTSGAALSGVLGSLNISSALTESRVTDTASSGAGQRRAETLLCRPDSAAQAGKRQAARCRGSRCRQCPGPVRRTERHRLCLRRRQRHLQNAPRRRHPAAGCQQRPAGSF